MTYILLGHVLMPLGMPNIDKKELPFRGKLYVDFCNTVILRSWLGSSSPKRELATLCRGETNQHALIHPSAALQSCLFCRYLRL
jgi:hypothetical protein